MEVTFALTPEDLWTFNLYVLRRTPSFKLRSGVNFVLIPLCLTAFCAVSGFGTWQCLLFGAVSAAVWVPFLL